MIKDEQLAISILESIQVAQEAVGELNDMLLSENNAQAITDDLQLLLRELIRIGKQLAQETPDVTLEKNCLCAEHSLNRILSYIGEGRIDHAQRKVEFELYPILQETYLLFYFWGYVCPDPERMRQYYESERVALAANHYIDRAYESGQYQYDLSITVTGYNHLHYTQQCVQSILEHVPEDLNYELVLYNHGSSDGTREYFESIKPHKQFDAYINGGVGSASTRILEGEYILSVSNDVVVTENAIANLLRCIRSDEKIGWVVPQTGNISNYQDIDPPINSLNKAKRFAKNYNRYDPYRHEPRTRLCNPLCMTRSSLFYSSYGVSPRSYFISTNAQLFPDDLASLLVRRSGYQSILAKDVYCHHYGSVTLKDEIAVQTRQAFYDRGRRTFIGVFGIDPWGIGFCYSMDFLALVECKDFTEVRILGINSGLGSNPLKLKAEYKEKKHNVNAALYYVTDDEVFLSDLKGLGDEARMVTSPDSIFDEGPQSYHHIVVDGSFRKSKYTIEHINNWLGRLVEGGSLFLKVEPPAASFLRQFFERAAFDGSWCRIDAKGQNQKRQDEEISDGV